jgi:hypothetical protein
MYRLPGECKTKHQTAGVWFVIGVLAYDLAFQSGEQDLIVCELVGLGLVIRMLGEPDVVGTDGFLYLEEHGF